MPSLYFVANTTLFAAPSDTNDGFDRFGFTLGGDPHSKSGSTVTATGMFNGYTHQAGDIIELNDNGDPITRGWYEIAAKVSNDEITLGDLVFGEAVPDGFVFSSDGPFLTASAGVAELGSNGGDQLRICADGTYTVTAELAPSASGNDDQPTVVTGANARGVPGTYANIVAGVGFSGDRVMNCPTQSVLRHLDLDGDGNASQILRVQGSGATYRLRIHGSSSHGVSLSSTARITFCEVFDNADRGINGGSNDEWQVHHCRIHGNGGRGISSFGSSQWPTVCNNLVYNNGSQGAHLGNAESAVVDGNVFYGNDSHGLELFSRMTSRITNNSFAGNGGYGLRYATSSSWAGRRLDVFISNHAHGNTSGHTNAVSDGAFTAFGVGSVVGDPLFKDANNGDFTPQAGSPLLNAGIDAGGLT